MPFDARTSAALDALRPQMARFRFAVEGTLERGKAMLDAESARGRPADALGEFAVGRIDPTRFAAVSAGSAPLDRIGVAILKRAVEVLESLRHAGDAQYYVDVPAGESAVDAIRERLARLGAAFGAAAVVELVRRHSYDSLHHGVPLDEYPFERWTASERRLAPPLVARLGGSDLDACELASLVDGAMQLVLLIGEPSGPAPLARLISPSVFVAQSDDPGVFAGMAALDGPAVIALMSGQEARFVHDPRNGATMWQRIDIKRLPDQHPRKALGGRSAWQQGEDLAHLRALVTPPVLAAVGGNDAFATMGNGDATERLAGWLLEQSNGAGVS